jgi:hypothetical protein
MPLMERGVQVVAERLPKVIPPKVHAIIDYAVAGSFFVIGALAWKNNKKAAIASFVCGGAELGTAMMTDYPGGVAKLISFPTHGKIDAGFSGVIGSMPNLMGFSDEWPAWFFRGQGMGMAAVVGLTDFEGVSENRRRSARYRAA